jgi:heptosyltransferase-2
LLTDPVPAPRENGRFKPTAMDRYYLELALRLGAPDLGTQIELFREPDAERQCDALFASHKLGARPLVCLAPGAGFGPSKLWPIEYVAEVARELRAGGADVVLVHGPGEQPLADEIARRARVELAMLGGDAMSLSLLKSVLARAQLLICNDAGARHIAAAFEVPTLVLMGPTAVGYTNLNLKRTKLLREPVECSPCQLKVCPIDHRCMTRLLPARVLAEARAALSQRDWQGSVELELAT